ncbi:SDR family oxidoreductase [Sporolactobacillus sp. STCC-11]|uniref:SDR family NAD(P)-dependent oxidoreductase n=1 Tax=Sporolactobacillus caesalpiniae TaxID=3230362 RepID=UPI003395ED6E
MFQHKTIVITGASSGLGSELARLFASKGANVIMLARNAEKLAEIQRQIEIEGGISFYYSIDISEAEAVRSLFQRLSRRFRRIDILINCAGIGKFQPFIDMDNQIIDQMLDVNVRGLIYCTQAVIPMMIREKHGGHIVNISSIAGIITTPKSVIYGATKHAVIGFSNGLRMELESNGIRVTVVNPGPIRTPFHNFADPSGHYVENVGRFMLDARTTSEKIMRAIEKKKREVNIPWYMGICNKIYQLSPAIFEKVFGSLLKMK